MIFPYREYHIQTDRTSTEITSIYRPVIPVRVSGQQNEIAVYGLLDTGADATVLPASFIQRLGIQLESGQGYYHGVGGHEVTVKYGIVEIEVTNGNESHHWSTRVAFLEGHSGVILGYSGFLELFDITFAGSRKEILLERNSSPALRVTRD